MSTLFIGYEDAKVYDTEYTGYFVMIAGVRHNCTLEELKDFVRLSQCHIEVSHMGWGNPVLMDLAYNYETN